MSVISVTSAAILAIMGTLSGIILGFVLRGVADK